MNVFECEFCHKIYSNEYVLKNHKLKTKICLLLRGAVIKTDLICSICKKTFSTKQNLMYHEKICEKKRKKPICDFCEKEFTSRQSLMYHIKICKKKESKQVIDLKSELEQCKIKLEELKVTPNNTTIIHNQIIYNNVSISNYLTPEYVAKTFEKYYTVETLMGGQRALADFVVDKFVLGSEKMLYLCVDRSRKKCMVTTDFKTFTEDVNNEILLSHLTPAFRIMKDMVEWADFERKYQSNLLKIHGSFDEILAIKTDGTNFRSQLCKRLPSTVQEKEQMEKIKIFYNSLMKLKLWNKMILIL